MRLLQVPDEALYVTAAGSRQPTALKTKADFLVFAGIANQMSSLEGTTNVLKERGKQVVEIGQGKLLHTDEQVARYIPFGFSALDIVKSLILLVRNAPSLFKELQNKHPAAIQNYFDNFCSVYTYLAYFYRILKQIALRFVGLMMALHWLRIQACQVTRKETMRLLSLS